LLKETPRVLAWAPFDAQEFGLGAVLCLGDVVVEVKLPSKKPKSRFEPFPDLPEARRGFPIRAAKVLSECFRTGADARALPHQIPSVTPYTRSVLEACLRIPHGGTWSYAKLAEEAGNPGAIRATGSVMARNPLALIIPCHRVIRSDGKIGNYGAGQEMKQHLLDLESGKRITF